MRKINKIMPPVPSLPKRKRVEAYARVSVEKGRTMHSLSAQISHYSTFIQKHSEWEYAGVYADSGESGTAKNRTEFKRLIADCETGKIDIILTKSISRFARNTVDLLETVRHLRGLGVEVRFEEQNINSLSGDGELMMTILASFAQEESRSLSENVKWAIRKGFKAGKTNSFNIYGYRWNGEKFIVHPEEAEVVRLIFTNFLNGISAEQTTKQLVDMGVKSFTGMDEFSATSVRAILRNDKYTGDLRLQKTYVENHISHKYMINKGELPIYLVEDAHEAIIDKATFEAVQAELARRRGLGVFANWSINTSVFTSKIKCKVCGCSFHRSTRNRTNGKFKVWVCANRKSGKPHNCKVSDLPEYILEKVSTEVLVLEAFEPCVFADKVEQIVIPSAHIMVFRFYDGQVEVREWKSTARKDCWTPERRAQHSEQLKKRVYTEEQRKARSERAKARYAENPNWNIGRREE